ncbi:MAG: RluA family pseudouridine synthase [Chitinophagales bacterium]|nr:RluA family pseudouridine synthase [Chitinophagales bacterium]MCZ2394808.1 RluA family pseudouridine synthase [Chitinophagales bacterium]
MTSVSILYEDNHLIIVNKPAGALVQGDKTGDAPISEEVKEYIKAKYNKPGEVFLGVIHRLDRPVSGIVIFARTSKALERMNALFKEKKVQKTYWAVVQNPPLEQQGTIKTYTIKDAEKLKAKTFSKEVNGSKLCILDYQNILSSERYCLLEVLPHTGRYHQIRSQLSYIGSPIKGDIKYGYSRTNKGGFIYLHARKINFIHPVSKETINITAPVPQQDKLWRDLEILYEEQYK